MTEGGTGEYVGCGYNAHRGFEGLPEKDNAEVRRGMGERNVWQGLAKAPSPESDS